MRDWPSYRMCVWLTHMNRTRGGDHSLGPPPGPRHGPALASAHQSVCYIYCIEDFDLRNSTKALCPNLSGCYKKHAKVLEVHI